MRHLINWFNHNAKLFVMVTFCLCNVTVKSYAQGMEIRGSVRTNQGAKLPYSTIKLMKDTIQLELAVSDSLGNFQLSFAKHNFNGLYLKAFYLNFSSKKIELNQINGFVNLTIEDVGNVLDNIEIKAERPLFIRKGDRFVYVPTKNMTVGSNGLDLMKHVPLLNYDEKSESISIINKSATVIYINNKKSQMPKEMLLQTLRSLPAENIKNIEIITNPGSEFSADFSGGIVNINIKRQIYEGWLGNLSIQSMQSAYNTIILNGGINYRKGPLALQFTPFINNSFNYYKRYNSLVYNSDIQNDLNTRYFRRYQVFGGGLGADYDINNKNFISARFFGSNVYGNSTNEVFTNFLKPGASASDSSLSSPSKGKDFYNYNFGNINYHYNIDSSGADYLDFNIDFNHFSQRRKVNGSFNKIDEGISQQLGSYYNDLPQRFTNVSKKIEYGKLLTKSLNIRAGAQYSNTHVNNDLKYYNNESGSLTLDQDLSDEYIYDERYWSGFISFSKEITSKWATSLGVRLENTRYSTKTRNLNLSQDSTYTNFFPAFSVSYAPNTQHQFGLSVSRKISRPNIELLFPGRTYNNQNYFVENNPFLKPSLVYNTELSYVLKGKYTLQASYSNEKNSYSNFVVSVTENNTQKFRRTYLNYGTKQNLGIVLGASQSFFGDFWQIYISPYINISRYNGMISDRTVDIRNYNFNLYYDNYFFLSKQKKLTAFLTFNYKGKTKDISGATLNPTSSLDFQLRKVVNNFSFELVISDLYNGSSTIKNQLYADAFLKRNYTETNNFNRAATLKVRYSFGNNKLKINKNRKTANEEIRKRTGS